MNIDDNRLYDLSHPDNQGMEELKERLVELDSDLGRAAKQVLKGQPSAQVSRNSGGKLSRWAAMKRREHKLARKAAAQQAKRQRRRERGRCPK